MQNLEGLEAALAKTRFHVNKTRGRDASRVPKGHVLRGQVSLYEYTVDPARREYMLLIQNTEQWVRTSVIRSWTDDGEKIVVQTKNSTYELIRA